MRVHRSKFRQREKRVQIQSSLIITFLPSIRLIIYGFHNLHFRLYSSRDFPSTLRKNLVYTLTGTISGLYFFKIDLAI